MKNNKTITKNYLDKIPNIAKELTWKTDEEGVVTLEIENKGFVNRIAQKLLKKPKVSYIHLDKFGSFVWKSINGEKTISEIGVNVKDEFGTDAEPLYERLAKYFQILESYNFIILK